MTGVGSDILLPASDVNTAQIQASSWPQLDSSWSPAPLTPHNMGEGSLPILMDIIALLVADGAGCKLVEMDDHKLIARGWPVAQLLEFQWEDSLLTKWCITCSLSKDASQTSTHQRGCGQIEERVSLFMVKEKIPLGCSYTIINLRCLMHSRSCIVMKCYIKLQLLEHFSSTFALFPSPWEHASICCNQLWFIHGRHVGVERHSGNDSKQ